MNVPAAPPTKRRVMAAKALVIGLVSGLLAVAFRHALEFAEALRDDFIDFALSLGRLYHILPSIVFGILIVIVVFMTIRFCPDAGGSGIPHLKGYMIGKTKFNAWKILLYKFFGGVLGIGSGLALGREGPTVQMGAAVAKVVGDKFSPNKMEKKILISAGAGAGLSAAFNAPMAGLFFVLEELHSSFHQIVLITAFISSVTADIVCRLLMGRLPVFHVKILHYPELANFHYFVFFGVFIGAAGLIFNKTLLYSSDYVKTLDMRKKIYFAAAVGVVLGIFAPYLPLTLGTGTELISNALASKVFLGHLAFFLILRFVFTMGSYATGAPGGIFAPLLLLGVLSGSIFGNVLSGYTHGSAFDFAVWGVLGMAGFFSAVVRAPITGTILILEMTGAYDLLLPIMVVSIISYGIPIFFGDEPIYEALLKRSLKGSADT